MARFASTYVPRRAIRNRQRQDPRDTGVRPLRRREGIADSTYRFRQVECAAGRQLRRSDRTRATREPVSQPTHGFTELPSAAYHTYRANLAGQGEHRPLELRSLADLITQFIAPLVENGVSIPATWDPITRQWQDHQN